MALIVEDGTGRSDAESYSSVAHADAYHAALGNTAWAGYTTDQKEVRLRRGTRYLDLTYGQRWLGARANEGQRLDWPREGAEDRDGREIDDESLPRQLQEACDEMALRAEGELLEDEDEPGALKLDRVKVGPIEVEEQWEGGRASATAYPSVERLVAGLVSGSDVLGRA